MKTKVQTSSTNDNSPYTEIRHQSIPSCLCLCSQYEEARHPPFLSFYSFTNTVNDKVALQSQEVHLAVDNQKYRATYCVPGPVKNLEAGSTGSSHEEEAIGPQNWLWKYNGKVHNSRHLKLGSSNILEQISKTQ